MKLGKNMNCHISIDVTDACESVVPKEKFRINRYKFGNVDMKDLVHIVSPHFHFQVLRPYPPSGSTLVSIP